VLSLQWQHINFKAGTYEIVAENNKSRRNKVYPLTSLQIEALPKPHQSFGLVFKGKNGNRINGSSFSKRHWKRVTERAGIMGMRLHDLRHLFGYLAVNVLNLPLEAVAEVLGHTSTQITARYANVGLQTVKSATDKFFELLKGVE
jgi:integrase